MAKNRKIKVIVKDPEKYFDLTGIKIKKGAVVQHEVIEVEELNKCECVELTKLQEKLLARNITKQEEVAGQKTEEVEKFLTDPELMNKLINEVNKNVAGEEDTILTIGLNACGRLVENASKTSYNVIPNDESGAGKDYTTENTLKVFVPEDKLTIRTRISPKVMNYWHNPKFEPNWTWDGRILYLKDVSDDVLNSEVMKTFTSDQTTATILINQMACDLETNGKPCVFCTTANSTPGGEQLRRFVLVPLDSSKEQTRKIKQFHAKRAVDGIKPERNKTIIEAMKCLERVKVNVPFAELLAQKFPDILITRTIFGTFIDIIKASAALHQYQRPTNEQGFVMANFQDYGFAREVLIKTTSKSGLIPITKNQRKILDIINFELDKNNPTQLKREHEYWTVKEISEKITFIQEIKNIYTNLNSLANSGFLKKGEKETIMSTIETNDGNRTSTKTITAYCIQEQDEFNLPKKEDLEAERNQVDDKRDKHDNNNNHNKDDKQGDI